MKLNTTDFGRRCQFPIMLAAGSLPIPLIICGMELPGSCNACLALAGIYTVLAWLCILTPGKMRIPVGLLCAVGMVAAGIALLPMSPLFPALLIPIMYAILLMGGLSIGGWEPGREMHPLVGAICLVLHMAAQFLVNIDAKNREVPIYSSVSMPLIIAFLLFGMLAMLALNRSSLNNSVNGRSAVPKAMRWKNRVLTFCMMAIILLVASLPAVIKAITKVWEWLKAGLLMLIQLILSMLPEQSGQGSGQGGGGMDLSGLVDEVHKESMLSKIITMVLMAMAILAVVVLIVIALRIVWRKLKVLAKAFWTRLNAYMASSSEDYVDEIADTRDDAEHDRLQRRRKRRLAIKRVDESTLNPQQRIRYRYLQMWLKHPEWTPERTARENLTDVAAQLYERARYSNHEITVQDAEVFAQKVDSRKG